MFDQTFIFQHSEPMRLDNALAALTQDVPLSKRRIRTSIDAGGVYVDKKRTRKAGLMLKAGQKIRLVMLEEAVIPFVAEQLLWQQGDLYLIHKRSGQYAQEALHRSQGCIPDALAKYLNMHPRQAKLLRPVHRLDRDTSGLMLLCSNAKQLQHLQALWHSHVQKSYLALVAPAPEWDEQRITLPIGKQKDRLGRYHVQTDGRACDTEAKVLQRRDGVALVQLTPHTGRTHQLRVHLSHIGCPILGDRRYQGQHHHRLMLHAHALCLKKPALPETMAWVAETEENWQWPG